MVTVAIVGALFGASGVGVARAEMTDPPVHVDVDWGPGSIPFERIGGIPDELRGDYQLDSVLTRSFLYRPTGGSVAPIDVFIFNSYKHGGCASVDAGRGIACDY